MSPVPSLRLRNKRDKWERIEAAAWRCFKAKGYEESTTREIAAEAGVAVGTLFLYARDKRELLVRLWYRDIQLTLERAALGLQHSEDDLVEDLWGVFATLFGMYEVAPDLARVFVQEVQFMPPAQRAALDDQLGGFFTLLSSRVMRAQEEGEVAKDLDLPACVQAIFALYFSALTSWLAGWRSREEALEGQLRPALALLMRGLAPRALKDLPPALGPRSIAP